MLTRLIYWFFIVLILAFTIWLLLETGPPSLY